jgi:hypothetical protein
MALSLVEWDYLPLGALSKPKNSIGLMPVFEKLSDLQEQFPGYNHVEIQVDIQDPITPTHLN